MHTPAAADSAAAAGGDRPLEPAPCVCRHRVARFLDQDPVGGVTVVDNGSVPGALQTLRAGLEPLGPRVELVETAAGPRLRAGRQRRGWARCLRDTAGAAWIALAPHDVDPEPGCLAAMLEAAAREPMAGLMCADVGDAMTPVIDPYFGGMTVPGRRAGAVGTSPGSPSTTPTAR